MSYRLVGGVLVLSLLLLACGGEEGSPAEEMSTAHEGDSARGTAAVQEPAIPVEMENVTYMETEDGEEVTGIIAAPSNPDSVLNARGLDPSTDNLPGLVVVHEWWGLNENIRGAARRLAGEGYRALAVDLYNDSTAETPSEAEALMKEATGNPDRIMANIQNAHEHLQSEEGAPRVGIIGWCFGGGETFRAVANRPTAFDAAVVYYGDPTALTEDEVQKLETPILAHFGREDQTVTIDEVNALESRVEGVDEEVQIHVYEAGHAFANPTGTRYDPDAANTAWNRTTDFLQEHLAQGSDS